MLIRTIKSVFQKNSGILIDNSCIDSFEMMKSGLISYAILKINDDYSLVVVEKVHKSGFYNLLFYNNSFTLCVHCDYLLIYY